MNNKASKFIWMPIFAVGLLAMKIAVFDMCDGSQMVWVYAGFILAFVMDLFSFRNWANEILIGPTVGAEGFPVVIEVAVAEAISSPSPIPTTSHFVKNKKLSKSFNRWTSHALSPTAYDNSGDFFHSKQNPSRPMKVKRAHDEPQSQSEMANGESCFRGRFKATEILTMECV